MTKFDELGLSKKALKAVARLGYDAPTPVQEKAIPLALAGNDVIAAAQTGTGKTAAFALPSMDKLAFAKRGKGPTMLVVTPTRELAAQIGEVCDVVARCTSHRVMTVVGGVSYRPQIEGLQRGCDVLIATPGRLEDLIAQGAADLSCVEKLVLDEADRMLDMGFLPSVKRIVAACRSDRQTMLFSATIDGEVEKAAKAFMHNPQLVEVAHKGETADTVDQYLIRIAHAAKPSLLAAVLREKGADRVIVFARTRHRADACCRRIKKAGFTADVIHSDRSQNQRKRALDAFASGRTGVLVATDVLARGIDVDQVSYVVNYDLPTQPEDYVHRIGRTGRAGQSGFSISFVSPENEDDLKAIQKLTHKTIEEIDIEGFDKAAAELEANDRMLQNKLRREKDPEVAKAMQEVAGKEKAKRKRAKAAESKKRTSSSGDSARPHRGKPTKANKPAKPGKPATTNKHAKHGKPAKSSKPAKTDRPAKPSKLAKRDVSPGRAQRAQRRRGSSS